MSRKEKTNLHRKPKTPINRKEKASAKNPQGKVKITSKREAKTLGISSDLASKSSKKC